MAVAPQTKAAASEAPAAEPAAAPANKSVRFVRSFRQYQRNDTCGFPTPYADQLIQKGVAVDVAQSRAVNQMIRK